MATAINKHIDLLIIALSSPVIIGVYERGELAKKIKSDGRASEFLIEFLADINADEIASITYTNTPGSFMGLKVSYQILRVFCEVKNIAFCAVSGFELNGGGAIRANKTLSFLPQSGDGDEILIGRATPSPFELPRNLAGLNKSPDTLPRYIIPAV